MSQADLDSTPVTRALQSQNIPYRLFRHPGAVHSLEQAAFERGQRAEQVIRSILFRLPGNRYVMVLVAGANQISWPRLRAFLGVTRMTMATPQEVIHITGYPTGAVSPFGLPQPVRILLDQSVLAEEEISLGAGIRNCTIFMHRSDLLQALGEVEIGNFMEEVT